MNTRLSQIRWSRLTWTALTVYGASFLLIFLIVTTYAFYLAFQVRGAPDQTMIQAFANQYAPGLGPIGLVLFTFLGARWLARFVKTDPELHGLVLGVMVSLVNLMFVGIGAFSPATLIAMVFVIGAGWLGGRLTPRA